MGGWGSGWWIDAILRRVFGKEKGDRISDVFGLLIGAGVLVWAVVAQRWWWAGAGAVLMVVSVAVVRDLRPGRPSPAPDDSDQEPPTSNF